MQLSKILISTTVADGVYTDDELATMADVIYQAVYNALSQMQSDQRALDNVIGFSQTTGNNVIQPSPFPISGPIRP